MPKYFSFDSDKFLRLSKNYFFICTFLLYLVCFEFPSRGLVGLAYAQPTHPPLDSTALANAPEYKSIASALQTDKDKVYKLNLSNQNLKELPTEVFQFRNLQVLDCSYNQLTSLPTIIGELKNLTLLDCFSNKLTSLPATVGELKSLTVLICYNNQLTSLPATIGELKSLTNLYCWTNQLTSLPATIGELKSLTQLICSENKLTSLPASLGELKSLTKLDCSSNQLTSLPATVGKLKSLKELNCSFNQLTSLPTTIGELKSLKYLYCYGNQLTNLPTSLGELKSLTILDCGNNQLMSLPASLGELKGLIHLGCHLNQLTSLPATIGELKRLTRLECFSNQLTSLPATIGELKNLTYFRCDVNKLTSLPASLGELKKINSFYCGSNQLITLPTGIGRWSNIVVEEYVLLEAEQGVKQLKVKQQYAQAMAMATNIRDIYQQKMYYDWLGRILNILATLYREQQEAEKALVCAEKVIELANLYDGKTYPPPFENQKYVFGSGKMEAEATVNVIKAEQKTLNAEKIAREKEALNAKLSEEKRKGEAQARLQAETDKIRAEKAETKAKTSEAQAKNNETKAQKAEREAHQAEAQAQTQRNIALGVGIVAVLLGVFALYQMRIARKERAKSEKLLLNILPIDVAHELKENGITEVRQFDNASILFADVKGFSALASRVTPKKLIAELDATFTKMDEIILKHGLERIKTIGDCYMAVGGVPHPSSANTVEMVLASLEIQKWMNDERQARNGDFWQVRLGLHTGELVAGVIGKTKFAYDVWGNSVNLASRMESGGEVGKVNTTEYTKNLIEDFFEFTFRGELEAKNIGLVNAYFVDRIKPELSADAEGFVPNEAFYRLRKEKFGR